MTATRISATIAGQPPLRDLDPEFIEILAAHANKRSHDRDAVVFRHGAAADTFYVVREGRITFEIPAIEGPLLELQRLAEGALLGWSWLIPPYRWSVQARTETPARVLEFDGRAIREQCDQDPRMGYDFKRFVQLMSERLAEARATMMEEWCPPGFA